MTLFGDKLVDVMSSLYASVRSRVTVRVEGYDTSLSCKDIWTALEFHFKSCGEVHSIEIPRDYVTQAIKSSSFVCLLRREGTEEKAMALNGKDFGGWNATIEVLPLEFNEGTTDELAAKTVANFWRSRSSGISVTGYDPSLPEDDVKTILSKHFSSCGVITEISIRKSRTLIYFYGLGAEHRAVKLSGTDFGGWTPVIKVLRPKPENNCLPPPFGFPPFGGLRCCSTTSGAAAPDVPFGPLFGSTISGAAAPDVPLGPPFGSTISGDDMMDFEYSVPGHGM